MTARLKKLWGALLLLVLMGGTGLLLARDLSPAAVAAAFHQADLRFLLMAAGLMTAFMVLETFKLRGLFLGLTGRKLGLRRSLGYAFVGFYFSAVTPSSTGGQPAQIYYMSRDGEDGAAAALTLLLMALAHQTSMVTLGGIFFATQRHFLLGQMTGLGLLFLVGWGANLAMLAGILALILKPEPALHAVSRVITLLGKKKILRDPEGLNHRLEEAAAAYGRGRQAAAEHPGRMVCLMAMTIAQALLMYLIPAAIYWAFHLRGFSLIQLLAVQSALTISVSTLPLPGSAGASEGSFLVLFRQVFGLSLVAPAMVLSRAVSFYLPLGISALGTAAVHLLPSRRKKQAFG